MSNRVNRDTEKKLKEDAENDTAFDTAGSNEILARAVGRILIQNS